MEDTKTVSQPERERLNPLVLPETALKIRVHSALKGMSQGELLDMLVKPLAPITIGEAPCSQPPPSDPPAK
jgi:hypothetical protein